MQTHIESREDLQWLAEVHKVPTDLFAVAILYGNEDCPNKVELYARDHTQCKPTVYQPNADGDLELVECGEVVIDHSEAPNDPSIKMRTLWVMFREGQYNYVTNINGTRQEIADYFRQGPLNMGEGDQDVLKTPYRLEFLPRHKGEPKIALDL